MSYPRTNQNTGFFVLAVAGVLAIGLITGDSSSVAQEQTPSSNTTEADRLETKDRSELQNMLRAKLKQLNDLQANTFEARQKMNREIRESNAGRGQLEKEVKQTRERLSERKSELKNLQRRIGDLKKQKKTLRKSLDQLDASADRLRNELSTHIDQTVPYERTKRRQALSSGNSSDTSPDPARRLRALTNAARNELSDATTSELLHRRVPLTPSTNPRKKHALLVRIGLNTLFYVTEDGKQSGYYVWNNDQWQVKPASPSQAQRFRHAIDVLRGQRAPERVLLPVFLPSKSP